MFAVCDAQLDGAGCGPFWEAPAFPACHTLGAEVDGQCTIRTALRCGKLGTSFR
jgi:hypothetical protein